MLIFRPVATGDIRRILILFGFGHVKARPSLWITQWSCLMHEPHWSLHGDLLLSPCWKVLKVNIRRRFYSPEHGACHLSRLLVLFKVKFWRILVFAMEKPSGLLLLLSGSRGDLSGRRAFFSDGLSTQCVRPCSFLKDRLMNCSCMFSLSPVFWWHVLPPCWECSRWAVITHLSAI